MAQDKEPTAGTPTSDDTDAGEQTPTSGTPEKDGRDAEPSGTDPRLVMEWKAKAERLNQVERELLDMKRAQAPAATRDSADPFDEVRRQAQQFAAQNDAAAKYALMLEQKMERDLQLQRKEQADYNMLMSMPEAEREEVARHYLQNPHRFGDPKAARADLREARLERELQELRKRAEKAERKPDPDVIRTHERESPRPQEGKAETVSREDFNQRIAGMDMWQEREYRKRILDGTLKIKG